MLNRTNITKAAILSVVVTFVYVAIQMISVTRIHTYSEDINWEALNDMPYSEALNYLDEKSHTITGVEVILQQIKELVLWYGSAVNMLVSALGFFISFIVLLVWVGRKKQP